MTTRVKTSNLLFMEVYSTDAKGGIGLGDIYSLRHIALKELGDVTTIFVDDFNSVNVPFLKQIIYSYNVFHKIINLARRQKPTLVCRSYNIYPVLWIVSKLLKTTLITWIYYPYAEQSKGDKRNKIVFICRSLLEILISHTADNVVVGSSFLQKKFPKACVIPNSVNTINFSPMDKLEARDILGLPKNEVFAISVGRLISLKNFFVLIEVAKKEGIGLIILGEGPLERKLKYQARQAKVLFSGRVPHNDMALWYNTADMFISSSLSEGCPKVLLEALSVGLPVIVSKIPAHQDIIKKDGEIGLICAPTIDKIREKASWILNNSKEAKEMGLRGRQYVMTNYSVPVIIEREKKYLKSILKLKGKER